MIGGCVYVGSAAPVSPWGGLVMTGIQLGDCDLILQGPVPAGQDDRCGWMEGWMDGGGGAARTEGDFMLLVSVDNHRH